MCHFAIDKIWIDFLCHKSSRIDVNGAESSMIYIYIWYIAIFKSLMCDKEDMGKRTTLQIYVIELMFGGNTYLAHP